jgi:hypothetical protein
MRSFNFVVISTTIVLIAGVLVSARGADIAVPRKGSGGRPDPRCYTAARYEAMREAYEMRLPDPCSGARVWVR